jgi:hypothetical protein
MYIDTLRCFRSAGRRKCTQKWRTNRWVLIHNNAPAHRLVLVKDFLAKNNVKTLEHFPCYPDLTSADFYMFLLLKSASKGRRFCNVTDIIKNAMYELKRLSQNCFQKCFQHLYTLWQKCIAA